MRSSEGVPVLAHIIGCGSGARGPELGCRWTSYNSQSIKHESGKEVACGGTCSRDLHWSGIARPSVFFATVDSRRVKIIPGETFFTGIHSKRLTRTQQSAPLGCGIKHWFQAVTVTYKPLNDLLLLRLHW